MTKLPDSQNSTFRSKIPGLAALLAFVICNGSVLLLAALSFFGISLTINPHLQAALICFFAVLATVFVFLEYKRHLNIGPVIVAGISSILIVGTMYVVYSKVVETLALIALIIAVIWSWQLCRKINSSTACR